MERKNGSGVDEREEENTLQEGDSANAMLLHQDTTSSPASVHVHGSNTFTSEEIAASSIEDHGTSTDENRDSHANPSFQRRAQQQLHSFARGPTNPQVSIMSRRRRGPIPSHLLRRLHSRPTAPPPIHITDVGNLSSLARSRSLFMMPLPGNPRQPLPLTWYPREDGDGDSQLVPQAQQLNRVTSGGSRTPNSFARGLSNMQSSLLRRNPIRPPLNRIAYRRYQSLGHLGNVLRLPPRPADSPIHNPPDGGNLASLARTRSMFMPGNPRQRLPWLWHPRDSEIVPQSRVARQVIHFIISVTWDGDEPVVLNVILLTRTAIDLEIHHVF